MIVDDSALGSMLFGVVRHVLNTGLHYWALVCLPLQVLTLANGDRILMTSHMKAFFEPENLNNASPATVSRAGIIYVSASELGWQPIVSTWLQV